MLLEPLPYPEWEATKTTLHLWCQVIGKLRLRYTPHRNHWWNVTLLPTSRGLSTQRMRAGDTFFEIELDLIEHLLRLRSNRTHADATFPLTDGLSVARFYQQTRALLGAIGIQADILAKPYGVPITTPFAEDETHRTYERTMARRFFNALLWTTSVFEEFAGEFLGKESPVHLFWHAFDLAMGRFSGRPAGGPPKQGLVEREAYSHEVIAFGFWPGDVTTPAPTFYTYTAPEPADLTAQPLRPVGAAWYPSGSGHLGTLMYETVRTAADPRATLREFLLSGYEAGTRTAAWDAAALADRFDSLAGRSRA